MNVFYVFFYFLEKGVLNVSLFFNVFKIRKFTKKINSLILQNLPKLLDKNEHIAEPYWLESESSSDFDEEPELSNVVMRTKTVILLENYSLNGLNNFV